MNDPLPMDLINYEPEPEDRIFYENVMNGHVGYLCRKEGKVFVNRGEGYPLLLYRNIEWKPVKELRPLTHYHVGLIGFEADKGMHFALGNLKESRRDWRDLTQEEKMEWAEGDGPGPKAEPERKILFGAIKGALKRFVA